MEKMTHEEAQQMIVQEMVEMLRGDHPTPLHWNDTTTHLVEVVRYVFISERMRDDMGFPLSQREIARRVFGLFGVPVPRNINSYLLRLKYIKGIRSQKLVDIMLYKANEKHEDISLSTLIKGGKRG